MKGTLRPFTASLFVGALSATFSIAWAGPAPTEDPPGAEESPAEESPVPWGSPAEASKYVLVHTSAGQAPALLDITTGQIVQESFPDLTGARLVAGRPKQFFRDSELIHYDGGSWRPEARWVDDDLYRMAWIEAGDVWCGEFDWSTGKTVRPRQVTEVGALQEGKGGLWAGNALFFELGADPQKPVVRVDLVSGAVEEIDWFMHQGSSLFGSRDLFVNPTKQVALHVVGNAHEPIRVIDLGDGREVQLSNERGAEFVDVGNSGTARYGAWISYPPMWIDDATLWLAGAVLDLKVPEIRRVDPRVTVDGAELRLCHHRDVEKISGSELLGLFVDPRFHDSEGRPSSDGQGLAPPSEVCAVFDVRTGEVQPLPAYVSQRLFATDYAKKSALQAEWLDEYRLSYRATDAGLAGNGTFLWDRRTNETVRLSPHTDSWYPHLVPEHDLVLFARGPNPTPGSTLALYKVGLDGTDEQALGSWVRPGGDFIGTLESDPIDLTYGLAPTDPWQRSYEPLMVGEAGRDLGDIASPETRGRESASAPDPGGSGDLGDAESSDAFLGERERLKLSLTGKPPGLQEIAFQIYDRLTSNYAYSTFYQALPTTFAAVEKCEEMLAEGRPVSMAAVLSEVDFSRTKDLESTKAYVYKRVQSVIHSLDLTSEQKDAISLCTAEYVAKKFLEEWLHPRPVHINAIDAWLNAGMIDCRK